MALHLLSVIATRESSFSTDNYTEPKSSEADWSQKKASAQTFSLTQPRWHTEKAQKKTSPWQAPAGRIKECWSKRSAGIAPHQAWNGRWRWRNRRWRDGKRRWWLLNRGWCCQACRPPGRWRRWRRGLLTAQLSLPSSQGEEIIVKRSALERFLPKSQAASLCFLKQMKDSGVDSK